eukprot:SAG31_NODE_5811_length_2315_cov_0.907491_2_plen_169_part_00
MLAQLHRHLTVANNQYADYLHSAAVGLSSERQRQEIAAPSSVSCALRLHDAPASSKSWGNIVVPWSDDRGAWANKIVPICAIRGPGRGGLATAETALLVAGNHGDEYEGQIALQKFCRAVDPADVNGLLIVVPTLSVDAAVCTPSLYLFIIIKLLSNYYQFNTDFKFR